MGNCQAVDAAALVIQHPSGRLERMYWPVTASEVMKLNPGHYVSLIIPLPIAGEESSGERAVRFTRVKLLRPTDTLVLGRAYRLVTNQEVMKVLRAKKNAKMKKKVCENLQGGSEKLQGLKDGNSEPEKNNQDTRHRQRSGQPIARTKSWRPSLQSISESVS
nr:endoglucanase 12 [Ipomoea batatas]